jgi:hypothetical protein
MITNGGKQTTDGMKRHPRSTIDRAHKMALDARRRGGAFAVLPQSNV